MLLDELTVSREFCLVPIARPHFRELFSFSHVYHLYEYPSSKSLGLFIEVLTFMVVHGCTLALKWTNTSEWASALAATSKT